MTLATLTLKELYRPHTRLKNFTERDVADLRQSLLTAKRFVLDDEMSSFLADLSITPFIANLARRAEVMDVLRHNARLPHPKIWIELNGRAFRARLLELSQDYQNTDHSVQPHEVPKVWGYLLEEYPDRPTIIVMREFVDLDGEIATLPMEWCYSVADEPLPWPNPDTLSGALGTGILSYICPYTAMRFERGIPNRHKVVCNVGSKSFITHKLAVETGGALRYVLAFLSTFNDLPVKREVVHPTKSFLARGTFHKFLEHTVVKLNVPQCVERTHLARRLVVAVRKRAHQVRGHWRVLSMPEESCEHIWAILDEKHQQCSICHIRRVWIINHQRGDEKLGFVTHDYNVSKRRK